MYEPNPERKFFFTADILISGKGGHSSVPHRSNNPVLASFALIQKLSEKTIYEFDSFDNATIFPVNLNAGTQQNIIPDDAALTLKGEASTEEQSKKLKALLQESLAATEILYHVKTSCKIEE